MAAAVDTDIDAFIREQKQKLASERQALHPGDDDYLKAGGYRGHWNITDGKETKFAEQNSQETGRYQPHPLTPVQDIGLPVGQYKKRRQAVDQQRQQDYQEYIHQKQGRQGLSEDTAPRTHQDHNSSSSQHFPQDGTCEHEGIPRKVRKEKWPKECAKTDSLMVVNSRPEMPGMPFVQAQLPIHQTLPMDFNNPTIIPFNRAEEEQERKQRMKELRNREYQEVLEKLSEPNNRRVNHLNSHADHKAHPLEKCAMNKQMSREQKGGHSVHEKNKNGMGDYPGGYEGLSLGGNEKGQARVREECGQDYQALVASKERERQYQRNSLESLKKQERELREELDKNERYQGVKSRPDSDSLYREEWAKKHPESNGVEHPAAEVTPRRTKSKLEGGISSPDYRQRWQEVHGKQSPEKRSRRKWDVPEHPFSESVLLRDVHADHQTLQQPRRPDNSTLREFRQEGKRSHRETAEEIASLPFGEHEDKRKALAAERRQDYSEMLKKSETKGSSRHLWKEPTCEELLPLGKYEQTQQKLQADRKQEYNKFLQEQTGRQNANLVRQTDEYKANFPGMNESDNAKIEKVRERNKEYNEFLREKNPQRGRPRFEDQTAADPGIYATLPGLRYSDSASKRRIEERNREYNEYLRNKEPRGRQSAFGDADIGRPPPAPRKGWATPTYEDMLNKKRQQEQQYRQVNDPVPLKSYGSEGGLNNFELDSRLWELDKELEANMPASFESGQDVKQEYREVDDLEAQRPLPSVYDKIPPPRVTPTSSNFVRPSVKNEPRQTQQHEEYYATLPIGVQGSTTHQATGRFPTDSAKQRQKAQYRNDLRTQIKQKEQAKMREKQAELQVHESGLLGMDRKKPVAVAASESHLGPRSDDLPAYHSKILETLSPRSEVVLGRSRLEDFDREQLLGGLGGRGTGVSKSFSLAPTLAARSGGGASGGGGGSGYGGSGGILNTSFDRLLLEPPARISGLAPPPGLKYEPASYITQTGGTGMHSSVDEAYNFYATRDPLDPYSFSGGGGFGGGGVAVSSSRLAADQELSFAGGGKAGGGGGNSRVRFDDQRHQGGRTNPVSAMDFPTDDDKKRQQRQTAQAYQEDLNRQIDEKRKRKQLEREERERYERKLELQAKEYTPFGRGGGGAPNRDAYGNIIADLRQMHHATDPEGPTGNVSHRSPGKLQVPNSVRDDLIKTPPVQITAEGEQSYARGGHGIFGMPKTDAEKIQADRYKEELMRQIEEKKMDDMRKREAERLAEERELQRVEEQQRRMQEEYEEERRKIRQKEEEARRKNEEMIREAEERKREAERKRKLEEEERLEDMRREKEAELNARFEKDERGKSPAVPALHSKDSEGEKQVDERMSPPVPAARTRTAELDIKPSTSYQDPEPIGRSQSSDVLTQLAAMRQQLQNERQRVESMLNTEKNEPDVFDPRLVQRPPPAPVTRIEVDVFETARNGNAVAVRRTPADRANSRAIADFSTLKNKDDSESRKEFRSMFPELPLTGDTLEAQQAALLRQQEENLKHLRQKRLYDSSYLRPAPPPSTHAGSPTPKQLHSNSAFVDVDNFNYLPDDFEDMPSSNRNESARARRRGRMSPAPRGANQGYSDPFGSTSSLNVDRLTKKNEDRLKRLRELQGDDLSLYDPDDVLDRFMSKQAHRRPPSGQTLQDDTWMYTGAGSKTSGY